MGESREARARPEVSPRPDAGTRARAARHTLVIFLATLTLLAAAYTAMAFGMDWRVESGRIGPGFFPRILGGVTVFTCLVAIVGTVRGTTAPGPETTAPGPETTAPGPETEHAEPATDDTGQPTDARVALVAVAGMALFLLVFETLGAFLSSVLFLGLLLTVVNRGHHRLNVLVSLLLPAGLYLFFEVLLDAGLPPGLVLPLPL